MNLANIVSKSKDIEGMEKIGSEGETSIFIEWKHARSYTFVLIGMVFSEYRDLLKKNPFT